MIYLDNASTTAVCEEARAAANDAMSGFGNPSSLHNLGLDAEKTVKKSRETIAGILGVNPKTIYFTSGGTEANNTAIFGGANIKRGSHIVTTKIEHPSVLEAVKKLELSGFNVTYIGADEDGRIRLDELSDALCGETVLVSVMHVNNETGTIQPVDKIKAVMKEKSPKALLHVDCVQSFGKVDIKPKQWGIDLASISAHKIHGIKGCGALYVGTTQLKPLLYGGGQQDGIRPGTENVVGIAAFGAAAAKVDTARSSSYMRGLRERLKNGILENIENVKINGCDEYSSGNILNVSFIGIKAEILLHSLERHGIYVSTGSACSSNKPMPSHVLSAMGCTPEEIRGAVRFSLSCDITEKDIDDTIKCLIDEVQTIRKYVR